MQLDLNYNSHSVKKTDSAKFLGLVIDEHLNWKCHIDHVCSKLERFALRRLRRTVSAEAAITAYYGYVASKLDYGLLLWNNSVDIKGAFGLQKMFTCHCECRLH